MVRTIAACLFVALACAGTAAAAPPTILTAGQTGGKAFATWKFPSGGQTLIVEVATSSATDSDGYFNGDDVVDSQVFWDGTVSWKSDETLDPGTYYLHVSASDTNCTDNCPFVEWTATRSFTVPGTPTPTPTPAPTPAPTPTPGPTPTPTPTPTPVPSPVPAPDPAPSSGPVGAPANAAPAIASVRLVRVHGLAVGAVRFCDDFGGPLTVSVLAIRGAERSTTTQTLVAATGGCSVLPLHVRLPAGSGRATVVVRVHDGPGAWSRPVLKRF